MLIWLTQKMSTHEDEHALVCMPSWCSLSLLHELWAAFWLVKNSCLIAWAPESLLQGLLGCLQWC